LTFNNTLSAHRVYILGDTLSIADDILGYFWCDERKLTLSFINSNIIEISKRLYKLILDKALRTKDFQHIVPKFRDHHMWWRGEIIKFCEQQLENLNNPAT